MVRFMQRVRLVAHQRDRLLYAARLIDRALLADRQVHRQVQERVRLALLRGEHGLQGRVQIGQYGMVFGMLGYPASGDGFNRLQRLARPPFGIHRAKKAPHVGLGGLQQHGRHCAGPVLLGMLLIGSTLVWATVR